MSFFFQYHAAVQTATDLFAWYWTTFILLNMTQSDIPIRPTGPTSPYNILLLMEEGGTMVAPTSLEFSHAI